jgi:hypothetical protein
MKSGVSTWLTTLNTIEKWKNVYSKTFEKKLKTILNDFTDLLLTVVDAIVDRESF